MLSLSCEFAFECCFLNGRGQGAGSRPAVRHFFRNVCRYMCLQWACVVRKLWFLRVLFKQYWVSLFPLIPSPVLVNYLPVWLYFTSPEVLSTLMCFWKPLFSKTSRFQKTGKKICVHTSIFISYMTVNNKDWKWRSKDAFCYQATFEQFLCPNAHAWYPKTLKACQISFAHEQVKHAHDYDITPFWKPPFLPFTLEW